MLNDKSPMFNYVKNFFLELDLEPVRHGGLNFVAS
jgi:hypothetical protein